MQVAAPAMLPSTSRTSSRSTPLSTPALSPSYTATSLAEEHTSYFSFGLLQPDELDDHSEDEQDKANNVPAKSPGGFMSALPSFASLPSLLRNAKSSKGSTLSSNTDTTLTSSDNTHNSIKPTLDDMSSSLTHNRNQKYIHQNIDTGELPHTDYDAIARWLAANTHERTDTNSAIIHPPYSAVGAFRHIAYLNDCAPLTAKELAHHDDENVSYVGNKRYIGAEEREKAVNQGGSQSRNLGSLLTSFFSSNPYFVHKRGNSDARSACSDIPKSGSEVPQSAETALRKTLSRTESCRQIMSTSQMQEYSSAGSPPETSYSTDLVKKPSKRVPVTAKVAVRGLE
ncbi:hypothetical protein EMMF5_000169 [Cystobasidiomycetes sp. EMM_F5]